MYNGSKISVIIPAFNEELSITKVLNDIPRDVADEIIVVDNGSTDRTQAVAAAAGAKVVKEETRGYGAACLRGIGEANDPDIVVILDADYSDHPEQLTDIVKPIAEGGADFVLGSRVMGKREKGALPPHVCLGNGLAVFLIKLLFGHEYSDMGPFRAIRYESLKNLQMCDKDFGWNAEMQVKAVKMGLKIKEVPVDYRKRIGRSKISGTIKGTILAGAKIIGTILSLRGLK